MKIRRIDPAEAVGSEHQALGIPPLEQTIAHTKPHPFRRLLLKALLLFAVLLAIFVLGEWLLPETLRQTLEKSFAEFAHPLFWNSFAVGLVAQIIDGALGMAYGITATSFLLSTGVSPAVASASVHVSEIFTTGFSGLSHWKVGNIDKKLFRRLLLPGLAGVLAGAWFITHVDGNTIKPWINGYLLLMGIYILQKGIRKHVQQHKEPPQHVGALAVVGGFVDSVGGGGWGPVVTTSLIGRGNDPRTTIGSVNAAEFFLSVAGGVAFAVLVGFTHWQVIAGLVFGGLFAAPFAAILCKKIPPRFLLLLVGTLIMGLSVYNLQKVFFG